MRLSPRPLFSCALLAVTLAVQTACSGGGGAMPPTPHTQAVANAPQAQRTARKPLDIGAFPVEIVAFPVDIGAFPVDSEAFAVCQAQTSSSVNAQCHSQYRSAIPPNPNPALDPSLIPGYHPSDLQNAYGLASAAAAAGSGQTVAVIVGYDAPALEADLGAYRTAFGLPACTKANGCLRVVYGSGSQPSANAGWAVEATLDVEMVSALCPLCKIMVVEAQDAEVSSLAPALSTAVANGATEISNSYSIYEGWGYLKQFAGYYNVPGVPITAGAGDNGYGTAFPAILDTVIAVGGTSLINAAGYGWASAVWSGTGSGCAKLVTKPSWQTDPGCSNRTQNDLAVVADPATGVAAYVSGIGGWAVFGGTSVGAPLVASMYALAGNASQISNAASLYANAASFAPVTSRPNGQCSITSQYLCNGGPGYTGPGGLGSPVGLSAF